MRVEEQFQELFQTCHDERNVEAGQVLIAEPFLQGRHFSRAVVYMVEHGERGSVGFVLNKPLHDAIGEVIRDLAGINLPLYAGGPVEPSRLYYFHRCPGIKDSVVLTGGIYRGGDFKTLASLLRDGKVRSDEVRFFAGYSGWDASQLRGELKENTWLTGEITPEQFFSLPNERLWEDSMNALGGKYRVWSTFPRDPMMN
ncbi:MAG: YqgE/AlgH family protein [Odoribacteraceae bacterium]|jgi:putative transcriptional regulator|nr:YqgE/AlgH family protein [Odoribacteraceae bacterium]